MPFHKDRYPKNWKHISKRTRERDHDRCKFCGVPNGALVARTWTGKRSHLTKIVLTVAHLNHDTTDNRDENLASLCQRCHLTHDAKHHAASAALTRRNKKRYSGQLDLFMEAE